MKLHNVLARLRALLQHFRLGRKKIEAPSGTMSRNVAVIDNFYSPELNNKRRILVYLPPEYALCPDKRYPVLYMHDGNNLFDEATSYIGVEWRMDKTANRLIASGRIKPVIIVGIYNNAHRDYEYTPVFDERTREGGQGDLYLDFIVNTLKPCIDINYRTMPDRDHTGIGGSSLGGLISLYGAIKHQHIFGFAAAISPSLWWANRFMMDYVKNTRINLPLKIWMDMGTAEGRHPSSKSGLTRAMIDCHEMAEILKSHKKVRFSYTEYAGARHDEHAWAARTGDILEFFFGRLA